MNGSFANTKQFYAELSRKGATITFGYFATDNKTRVALLSRPADSVSRADIDKWLGDSSLFAVVLFHAMWGQQPSFHKRFVSAINDAFVTGNTSNQCTISIIWHAGGLNYKRNWNRAFAKGEQISPALNAISQYLRPLPHVLCHSMGNRVFEGSASAMQHRKQFASVTFFSADISNQTNDAAFAACMQVSDTLAVYLHKKDRLLKLSGIIHGNGRLGQTGPDIAVPDIAVTDMTAHARSFLNHSHFSNPWVKNRLKQQWQ